MATVQQLLDVSDAVGARGIIGVGASVARSGLGGLQCELSSYAHSDHRSVPSLRARTTKHKPTYLFPASRISWILSPL